MPSTATGGDTLLIWPRSRWQTAAARHRDRVEALLAPIERRAVAGHSHPVEDFLFTYYAFRPNQLRRWHPGVGTALADAADSPHRRWSHYTERDGLVMVDEAGFRQRRRVLVEAVRRLLRATLDRRPAFDCFGMHEWAMVYRRPPAQIRHHDWPLRLGSAGTDAVVADRPLRCSHFDAFRFFTPEAAPRNATPLTRDGQAAHEQGGCVHANMDLYKWAYKLVPATGSELVLDCYLLALDSRYLDMAASPYDLSALDVEPVAVETPEGRAEYAAAQRVLAERARRLRGRLLGLCDRLNGSPTIAMPSRGA